MMFIFKRELVYRKANRKSQKLFPYGKILENLPDVFIHIEILGPVVQN